MEYGEGDSKQYFCTFNEKKIPQTQNYILVKVVTKKTGKPL